LAGASFLKPSPGEKAEKDSAAKEEQVNPSKDERKKQTCK
jgi:hypothetical protein